MELTKELQNKPNYIREKQWVSLNNKYVLYIPNKLYKNYGSKHLQIHINKKKNLLILEFKHKKTKKTFLKHRNKNKFHIKQTFFYYDYVKNFLGKRHFVEIITSLQGNIFIIKNH